VALELGQQRDLDVAEKLRHEVEAECRTWLDRMLIAESQEQGIIDLRPEACDSYAIRANRHLLVDRARRLERYGLTDGIDTGRWAIRDDAERSGQEEVFANVTERPLDLAFCLTFAGRGGLHPVIKPLSRGPSMASEAAMWQRRTVGRF
jgi:hypothetical protein